MNNSLLFNSQRRDLVCTCARACVCVCVRVCACVCVCKFYLQNFFNFVIILQLS